MSYNVIVFSLSEQVEEDQGKVQGPGRRGSRADDAAARGEAGEREEIQQLNSDQSGVK